MAPFEYYKSPSTLSWWMRMDLLIRFNWPSRTDKKVDEPSTPFQSIYNLSVGRSNASWHKLHKGDRNQFPRLTDSTKGIGTTSPMLTDFMMKTATTFSTVTDSVNETAMNPPLTNDSMKETANTPSDGYDSVQQKRKYDCTSLGDNENSLKETKLLAKRPQPSSENENRNMSSTS